MTDSPYVYSTPQIQRAKLDWQAVEELAPVTDDDTLHGVALDAVAQADAYSAFGINFAGDIYEEWRWFGDGGYMELLGANRTEVVNLTGAGQYNEAVQRAVAIQHHYPHMKILWRHMISQPPGATDKTDKGMWRLPYTEFVDNLVINYGYRDHGWYVVTDCEGHIGGNELDDYARMEAQRLDYGVPKGAKFAVLRMSTHHPSPAVLNSGVLDRLLESVRDHMGDFDNPNVVVSNNGYFDDHHPDPAHWNLDGLQTAVNLLRRCQDKFKFTPRIIMGEYNYDRGLTSEHGPNAEHMPGDVLVGKLNGRYADKLQGVAQVLVYCCGIGQDKKVKNFHLDNETARKVVLSAPRWEKPTMATSPILVQPSGDIGDPKRVRIGGNRNLRYGPHDGLFTVVRTVVAGTEFDIHPDTQTAGNGYAWYWTGDGWISDARGVTLFGAGSAFAEVATPHPPVPGLPEPEASVWTPRRLTLPRELLDAPFLEAGKHTDDNGNVFDHERGTVLATVPSNTVLAIYLDILYSADGHDFIGVKVTLDGVTRIGWMPVVGSVGLQFVALEPVPPVEPPPVEEDDTQPGPPMDDKAARQAAWKLLKEGHEARAVAQQAMREADDLIAQGWQALMLLEDLNNEEAA